MRLLKVIILIATLGFVSCKGDVKSTDAPRKVKCKEVELVSDSFESSTFPGKIVAATDVNLGFRVAGIIENITVKSGEYVQKGDIIARLDNRDYTLQLAATQAEYDAIKAEVDRVVALYADQSISANDFDKATNGLRQITAKLEAHKNALSDTELRAPFSGYIQKSNFARGEAVAAGTPVVAMISASAPEVTIDIPTAYYLKHKDFESATASIDLYPDTKFNLQLKGITPKANLNQLHKVTFVLEGVEGVVPSAGVSTVVQMRYFSHRDSSVVIPFSSIVELDGVNSVWIVENDTVKSREVRVSEIKSCGDAIITSGLSEGEMVVVAGVNSLKEGQKVALLEDPSASNVGGIK